MLVEPAIERQFQLAKSQVLINTLPDEMIAQIMRATFVIWDYDDDFDYLGFWMCTIALGLTCRRFYHVLTALHLESLSLLDKLDADPLSKTWTLSCLLANS